MEISDIVGAEVSDVEVADKIAARAYSNPTAISEEDVNVCKLLCKSGNDKARRLAATAFEEMVLDKPELVAPVSDTLWGLLVKENEQKQTKSIARNVLEKLKHDTDEDIKSVCYKMLLNDQEGTSSKDPQLMAQKAASLTVTKDRVRGKEPFFVDSVPYLEFSEQPHFTLALSKGKITPDWSFAVEKQGRTVPIIEGDKTASLVVTDHGVRILSREGEWAIPYGRITHVQAGSYPALKIFIGAESYKIRLARSVHSKEDVSDCGKFIMKMAELLDKHNRNELP